MQGPSGWTFHRQLIGLSVFHLAEGAWVHLNPGFALFYDFSDNMSKVELKSLTP